MEKRLIDSEAVSDSGIHVATGIIVDALLEQSMRGRYSVWYINIYTLVRNFISCMEGNTEKRIQFLKRGNINRLIDELADDVNIMVSQLSSFLPIYLYKPDYTKVRKSYPNIRSKEDFKGIKYFIKDVEERVIKGLKSKIDITIIERDHTLPYRSNALITTHVILDLANFTTKRDIILAESHTAEFKKIDHWHTKFYKLPKKDMSVIPFTPLMIIIFGDKEYVRPFPIKFRLSLYKLALVNRWSTFTRESRWLSQLKKSDAVTYNYINNLPRLYK